MAADSPEEERKRRDSDAPPLEFLRPGETQSQVPPASQSPAWVPRPEDYKSPTPWRAPPTARPGASSLPLVAAILLLLSAGLGMAGAIYNAITLPSVPAYADYINNNTPETVAVLQICGLISIWAQAMALLGGIMAYQRMNWKLTLVCAIFSLATIGFFYFEASLVGLLGLIFVVRSRPYFVT